MPKHPGGRPKGSKSHGGRRRNPAKPGIDPRRKTQPCPALSKKGHGTDWHCDACNDSGEVSA